MFNNERIKFLINYGLKYITRVQIFWVVSHTCTCDQSTKTPIKLLFKNHSPMGKCLNIGDNMGTDLNINTHLTWRQTQVAKSWAGVTDKKPVYVGQAECFEFWQMSWVRTKWHMGHCCWLLTIENVLLRPKMNPIYIFMDLF